MLSTLVFPSLFFLFFALPNIKSPEAATKLMGSFATFAVLSVIFLQFGVELCQERHSSWSTFLKTLPARSYLQISARVVFAAILSLLSAWTVCVVVQFTTEATFDISKALVMSLILLLGGLCFAAWAILISYFVSPVAALPITNLLYLTLSFAGGLWIPPEGLSKVVQDFSVYLPTRHFGELVWSTWLPGGPTPSDAAARLGAFGLIGWILVMVYQWRARKTLR